MVEQCGRIVRLSQGAWQVAGIRQRAFRGDISHRCDSRGGLGAGVADTQELFDCLSGRAGERPGLQTVGYPALRQRTMTVNDACEHAFAAPLEAGLDTVARHIAAQADEVALELAGDEFLAREPAWPWCPSGFAPERDDLTLAIAFVTEVAAVGQRRGDELHRRRRARSG